ncbi:2-C-methyl-D-erythritol 2,4-cyclodiphosphate synthase [Ammoniphilus oxalaticus]|uniref:2-C-methyl-D-erythritol 2,4-cyclodiphosphate synthase n=1 Tax=Ammoniphilus oxalaticus TaxID=66863 RepID=A0A419SG47_9BACL|nr:2-C-methyl-D-erythritol 2,4-cyclodiphosphate synthase [Ammoniphilus oxalaticus]RKD22761.1 2-C-methyl-D-erythritol 2,4-cyclodiphosphate synthase [Ammoniphilus oxalaticus]
MLRIGQGFDVHRFAEDRDLIIGGAHIPYDRGLLGHSDADVLLHVVSDAILGAIGEGDIGKHFPDTDEAYKDADSKVLLSKVVELMSEKDFRVINIDCTIMAERPKMLPYIPQMQTIIAQLLKVEIEQVNIKATTTEKLGFVGREEGIAALAVVLLGKENA